MKDRFANLEVKAWIYREREKKRKKKLFASNQRSIVCTRRLRRKKHRINESNNTARQQFKLQSQPHMHLEDG